mmetsp:Transcript_18044/g.53983  ORF Transcript_18044/g.53983 Transcript_18044/m.53983 type:complete len:259 (-) Transcript_18044:864-1640(-)
MVAVARLAQVAEDAYDGDEHAEQHVDRVPEVVEVEGDGRREGARRLPVGLDLVELAEDGGDRPEEEEVLLRRDGAELARVAHPRGEGRVDVVGARVALRVDEQRVRQQREVREVRRKVQRKLDFGDRVEVEEAVGAQVAAEVCQLAESGRLGCFGAEEVAQLVELLHERHQVAVPLVDLPRAVQQVVRSAAAQARREVAGGRHRPRRPCRALWARPPLRVAEARLARPFRLAAAEGRREDEGEAAELLHEAVAQLVRA